MKDVFFIKFPCPSKRYPNRDVDKIARWVRACSREDFKVENITKDSYICSKHFVGGKGPTDEHPDPIPANYCQAQVWLTTLHVAKLTTFSCMVLLNNLT
jgi:hypothetical protein